MKRTRFMFIAIAALAMSLGCQTQHRVQSQCDMLIAVDLTDGTSKSEAMIISQCYSEKHLGAGPIDDIWDRNNDWRIGGRFGGWVAKPLSFEIDKSSGAIKSTVGPSYQSPFDMLARSTTSAQAK